MVTALTQFDDHTWSPDELNFVVRYALDVIVIHDPQGYAIWANEAFVQLTEYKIDELIGRRPVDFLPSPHADPAIKQRIQNAMRQAEPLQTELNIQTRTGRELWVELLISPVFNEQGELIRFVTIARDITERNIKSLQETKSLQEIKSRYLLSEVLQNMDQGLLVTMGGRVEERQILLSNPPLYELLGLPEGLVDAGRSIMDFIHFCAGRGDFGKDGLERFIKTIQGTEFDKTPVIVRQLGDRSIRSRGVRLSTGELIITYTDITSIVEHERELKLLKTQAEYEAHHDHLTGLGNRRYLDAELQRRLMNCAHGDTALAIMHIDLDRFKHINDRLGHAAGDFVLKHTADLLRRLVRADDFVARIGGDEFVILIDHGVDRDTIAARADMITREMARSIPFQGNICRVGCSIGVHNVEKGMSVEHEDVLRAGDDALFVAKQGGRGRSAFVSADMQNTIAASRALDDEVMLALENGEFLPFYQPQYDGPTLQFKSAEALARWHHPSRGILPPAVFLEPAARLGILHLIDEAILEQALHDLRNWRQAGFDIAHVSVNVSAQRLYDGQFIDHLRALDIQPGELVFEIVETTFIDQTDAEMQAAIAYIRDQQIEIEIDDFGTGHASILGVMAIEPTRLKIARELIDPATHCPKQRRMVEAIIDMASALGIAIVAEGVETMAHVELLQSMGAQILQGYALARPMPSDALEEIMPKVQAGNTTKWAAPAA